MKSVYITITLTNSCGFVDIQHCLILVRACVTLTVQIILWCGFAFTWCNDIVLLL